VGVLSHIELPVPETWPAWMFRGALVAVVLAAGTFFDAFPLLR
jgi:ABC-type microcin C transport system permease subunit YejB